MKINTLDNHSFASLSLQPDRFCLIRTEGGALASAASRELVQPFGLEAFAYQGAAFQNYAEIIKDLWIQSGRPAKKIGFVLSHDLVLMRKLPVPLGLEDDFLQEHLHWETDQGLVSARDEYLIDYQRLPAASHAGHPIYLAIMLRKAVLKHLRKFCAQLGVALVDLDVDIFSWIRIVTAISPANAEELVVLINMDSRKITVVILKEGDFYLKHHIAIDESKRNLKGQRTSEWGVLLQKEIKRLIFGHRLGGRLDAMDRIVVTGEGVTEELFNSLSEQMDVPVTKLNSFSHLNSLPAVAYLAGDAETSRQYDSAVGMALKQKALKVK